MWVLFVATLGYLGREVILYRSSRAALRRTITTPRPAIFAPIRGVVAP